MHFTLQAHHGLAVVSPGAPYVCPKHRHRRKKPLFQDQLVRHLLCPSVHLCDHILVKSMDCNAKIFLSLVQFKKGVGVLNWIYKTLKNYQRNSLPWNSIWLEELCVVVEPHCWLLRIQLESCPAVENIARIANAVQCHNLLSDNKDGHGFRFSIVRIVISVSNVTSSCSCKNCETALIKVLIVETVSIV